MSISGVGTRRATAVEPNDTDVGVGRAATRADAPRADATVSTTSASTFDTDAAKATPTSLPADVEAARSTELTSLTGSPASQKSSDVVQPQTQVATIVQAAKPDERDAVRAHFDKASAEDRAKAFDEVLKASTTQGTRPVALGPFTGSVTVDAKGDVNGEPLPSDGEVTAGAQLANLGHDDRKGELRQVGVDERWLGAASEGQVLAAFNQVELRRQFGAPGAETLQLPELRQQMGRGMLTIPASTVSYSVTQDRQLTNAAGVTAPAASQAALTRIAETEGKEWPGGTPESRLKTRIEDTSLAIPDSEKLATVTSVLSEADSATFSALVNTPPGVQMGQLETAYQAVLEARKTPGEKNLDLTLTPLETQETYGGESGGTAYVNVEKAPVSFSTKLTVGVDGKVNGKTLGVDELARLSSQLTTVPAEAKEAALKEAGLSESWLGATTPEQRDYALAKLRQATGTPGEKTLDFSFSVTATGGGESDYLINLEYPAQVKLNVGGDGKVDGKTPSIEVALATTLTMEKMSMVEKRLMMSQLGIPSEGLRTATPQEASDLLTRVALRTKTPGEQQFEAKLGGKDYIVGLKVGEKGELQGVGAMLKPVPPEVARADSHHRQLRVPSGRSVSAGGERSARHQERREGSGPDCRARRRHRRRRRHGWAALDGGQSGRFDGGHRGAGRR